MMALSPSPKRIPLALASVPPVEDDSPTAAEVSSVVEKEVELFKRTGKLAPRAAATQREQESDEKTDARAAAPETEDPADESRLGSLPGLRVFFDAVGSASVAPVSAPWLDILFREAWCLDRSVTWHQETELERRIRVRNDEAERRDRERRAAADEMRRSQLPSKSEYEVFNQEYKNAMMDLRLSDASDKIALLEIDRRAEREAAMRDKMDAERKRVGEERKAAARAAMEARRKEREAKVLVLMDADEDARDDVDAVKRVRYKLEMEKQKESGGSKDDSNRGGAQQQRN